MARCFNQNTKEYKDLLKVHGDTFTVDLLINDWQSMTGSESIPSTLDVDNMLNSSDVIMSLRRDSLENSLLRNLANKNIISKYNNRWYVNVTVPGVEKGSPTNLKNNVGRLQNYLRNQNLANAVSLKRTANTYEVIVNNDMFTKRDLIADRSNQDSTKIIEVLNHLNNLFPQVKVRYMTPGEAKTAYDSLPKASKRKVQFKDIKSFYYKGNAVIIKGRVTKDTAVEEVLHPFVDALYKSNGKLFSNMLSEAKKTFPELAQQIESAYSAKKGFSAKDRGQELVTQALSRHFNNEYETTPSKPWYKSIKDFLKWFSDIIKDVYKNYMGGKLKLNVGFIRSDMTMSEMAKMLNTSEFEFRLDLNVMGDRMVQYSLSKGMQSLVDTARMQSNPTQSKIITRILHQVEDIDDVFDSLGASRVTMDSKSGKFVDVDSGDILESLENKVHSSNTDYSYIVEGIMNQDDTLIDPSNNIRAIAARIDGMKEDGSVILPGVVLADPASGIATKATALRIRPDGSITVISIMKESDVKGKQSTYINAQRQILENIGYDVTDESFTIFTDNKGAYTYTKMHRDSHNAEAVEELVPSDIDTENKSIVDEILGVNRKVEGDNPTEDSIEGEPEFLDSPTYDALFGVLKPYRKVLLKREQGIKTARNIVSMDGGRKEIIEQVQMSRLIVEQMYERPEEIKRIYVDVIKDALRQLEEIKEYATNPENFDKPEFISKILNWQKYIENFRGLVNLTESVGLNKSELKYKDNLQKALNDIIGIRKADSSIVEKGIFDIAIKDYVRELIKNNSNRNFTPSQLDELLTTARDINAVEYQSGDMATSRDTILALMDKLYKRDRQKVLDKVEARAPRIRAAALKLARLNASNKIDYSFMLEFDDDGNFTGRYVTKVGKNYTDKQREVRSKLYDENGFRKYITIENKEEATDEQLNHNKQLAKDKEEYGKFMRAEIKTETGVEDGEYHKYSDDFKEARSKHEVYIYNAFSEIGRWVKRNDISDQEYRVYLQKYYDILDDYETAVREEGVPTGATTMREGIPVIKKEFVEVREISSEGLDLVNEKYRKLNNPTTELQQAQLEYYNMFIDVYQDELMEKLPENVKMIGKVPVIQGEVTNKLKDKSNLLGKMWAGMKKFGSDLIHPSTKVKKVFTDENGDIIHNSLPLFFTGSIADEQTYQALVNELDTLKDKMKDAASQKEANVINKEIKALRGKIKAIERKPTPTTLSMDMTDSLLKFSAMAENYETMAQAEDTHLAMLKVLENRTYTNSRGDIKTLDENNEAKDAVDNVGQEAKMVQRAKKWMKMVFYNNDQDVKTFWDKLTKGLISYTSLAYVGTNVFGNINNYAFGRISNTIETYGQRFYSRKGMAKSVIGFNKRMIPDFMLHLGKVAQEKTDKSVQYKDQIPYSKYAAMVAFFRMMDSKADQRESGDVGDMWNKYTSWAYALQDAGEFNVQSKIGMAILHSTTAVNPATNATMSLYDALSFDRTTGDVKLKDGFTKIKMYNSEKLMDWNADTKYDIRNYIRETNKIIHGNYAYEDRMVMQSHSLGQLAAQFHKWVAPSIKARFRPEYFDENLGWMEGRYLTFWNFLGYAYKNIGNAMTMGADYKEFHGEKGEQKLQNVHRVMGEIAVIMSTYLIKQMLMSLWGMSPDDSDEGKRLKKMKQRREALRKMQGLEPEVSDLTKRLRNVLVYQMDRLHDETVLWVPIPGAGGLQQMGHFIQNPIASSRTLGEMGEAIEMTARTGLTWGFSSEEDFYSNKDVVYQRGISAGKMKLGKEWGDAAPFLYTANKWRNFIQMNDFYIK